MNAKLPILVLTALLALPGRGQETPPSERLEYARYLRDAKHDTPKAMAELEKILAASPPAEVALSAKLLLTACQLELGQKDAASKGLEALIKQKPGAVVDKDLEEFAVELKRIEKSAITPLSRQELLTAALKGVAEKLGPGAEFMDAETLGGFKRDMEVRLVGIGAILSKGSLGVEVKSLVRGSPAERDGVRVGWIIQKVAGRPTTEIGSLQNIVNAVRGAEGSKVEITFLIPDQAAERTITLQRQTIHLEDDDGLALPRESLPGAEGFLIDKEAGIVLLPVHSFAIGLAKHAETVLRNHAGLRGLVIDLRGNGGGALQEMADLAGLLLPKGTLVAVQKMRDKEPVEHRTKKEPLVGAAPVLVMVDELSASVAEVFAAALQDSRRAVIFGNRTMGHTQIKVMSGGVAGGMMKLPVGEYFRPSGAAIHRPDGAGPEAAWGVTPDVTGPKEELAKIEISAPPEVNEITGELRVAQRKIQVPSVMPAAVAELRRRMEKK